MPGRAQTQTPTPVDEKQRRQRIGALEKESLLRGEVSKRMLAETAVDLRLELDRIEARRAAGDARADEVRILPGLYAQLGKTLDRLGLTAADITNLKRPEADDEEDDE